MRRTLFRSRRKKLEEEARLVTGSRVRYRGEPTDGVKQGSTGAIVSDVPARMDVTPFGTPPTVPENDLDLTVEVDFEEVGRRRVALHDVVLDEG